MPQPLYTAESAERTNNPMIGSCANSESYNVAEDALLIKPRTRLMSTNTILDLDKQSEEINWDENGEPIVPVLNYNPGARQYGQFSDNSPDNQRNRVLDSLRRRFSKKCKSEIRRASASYADFYEKNPTSKCDINSTVPR